MSCLINDSGEGTKGLDLGEEDGSPYGAEWSEPCGDDLLQGTTEVGMDSPPSNCLPKCVSGDERWFGFANHYIKGTVVGTRYVLMMQCLSYLTMLSTPQV